MNTKGIAYSDGSDEDKPHRNTFDFGLGSVSGRRVPIYQIPEEEQDDDTRSQRVKSNSQFQKNNSRKISALLSQKIFNQSQKKR